MGCGVVGSLDVVLAIVGARGAFKGLVVYDAMRTRGAQTVRPLRRGGTIPPASGLRQLRDSSHRSCAETGDLPQSAPRVRPVSPVAAGLDRQVAHVGQAVWASALGALCTCRPCGGWWEPATEVSERDHHRTRHAAIGTGSPPGPDRPDALRRVSRYPVPPSARAACARRHVRVEPGCRSQSLAGLDGWTPVCQGELRPPARSNPVDRARSGSRSVEHPRCCRSAPGWGHES
jgi:hypothetical protein